MNETMQTACETLYSGLHEMIREGMKQKQPMILAVDGRCGSGKSTLAEMLLKEYPASVIHMDDFFLRPQQRTKERLEETGGNIDYERFTEEAIRPLEEGREEFAYQRYDCSVQKLTDYIHIRKSKLIIVEGAYSCHPRFCHVYDRMIFMEIDRQEQARRILTRNGEAMLQRFLKEWIPKEEKYFDTFRIREQCDLIL